MWRTDRSSGNRGDEAQALANQSFFTPSAAKLFVWLLMLGAFVVLSVSALFAAGSRTLPEKPRVLIQTTMGDIEVELNRNRAPATVTNFLRYVEKGHYRDGVFHRTVTLSNQPANKVKIEVIQASANPAKTNEFLPPFKLERTRDTGLRHHHGTISMARDGPDTAQDEFFICIGDQPELDFGGKRNPDGQGFAAFGKVVKGMDVVRRIQASPADGQKLTPPVTIQRAVRLD
jgi:peptidyl-prolyl cis-trans isomerase A (cyclophilin A)